jgi:hypothetical protein
VEWPVVQGENQSQVKQIRRARKVEPFFIVGDRMKRIPNLWWWAASIALCAGAVAEYIRWMRPYALQVYSTVGPLQDSNAGGNVQGLFTYHGVLVAILALVVVFATAVAALIQLVQLHKDRDLEVAVRILRYHEDSDLFRLRGFVNLHMEEINKLIANSTDRETVDAKVQDLSEKAWELEDIYRLVSILNHTCLFIRKDFISPDIGLEFYPVITRMWILLEPLVYYERRNRTRLNVLHGEWYSDHFEKVAREMLSPAYSEKVKKRLGLRAAPFGGAGYLEKSSFATQVELEKAFTEIASLRDELQELQNRISKPSS